MATTEITRATIEDAEAILALQKLAYQSEAQLYNDYRLPPLTETVVALRQEFARCVFLKAVGSDGICGSVRARKADGTCFIGRLIVHPAWRRQGIATCLMQEIESCFADIDRYELFTGYKSQGNLRLYEGLGYRVFKEEQPAQGPRLVFLEKRREPSDRGASRASRRAPGGMGGPDACAGTLGRMGKDGPYGL